MLHKTQDLSLYGILIHLPVSTGRRWFVERNFKRTVLIFFGSFSKYFSHPKYNLKVLYILPWMNEPYRSTCLNKLVLQSLCYSIFYVWWCQWLGILTNVYYELIYSRDTHTYLLTPTTKIKVLKTYMHYWKMYIVPLLTIQ